MTQTQTPSLGKRPLPAPRGARPRYVRDLMTENVFTMSPKHDLVALYDLMDTHRVRHVPVVDKEGDVVGLVTLRNLFRGALGSLDELPLSVEREMLRRRRVHDIMETEPDTIEPDATLVEAAELLLENKVGCLLVVEGMRLVGILTEADFVRDFLEKG